MPLYRVYNRSGIVLNGFNTLLNRFNIGQSMINVFSVLIVKHMYMYVG